MDAACGALGHGGVVRHEHECCARALTQVVKEVERFLARAGVEVARRLVGQQKLGRRGEGARKGHALLLATGELGRVVMPASAKAHAREQVRCTVTCIVDTGELEREDHVLERGEVGEQLEVLEHEADATTTEACERVFVEGFEGLAVEEHAALGRAIESGEETEQRRLAATRRAEDREVVTARNDEIDAVEDRERRRARGKTLHEPPAFEEGGTHEWGSPGGLGREYSAAVTPRFAPALAVFALLVLLSACGDSESTQAPTPRQEPSKGATATKAPQVEIPADAPKVVFLGDSLSAGMYLASHEAFPAVLERTLATSKTPFRLVNAGVSGSPTRAGLGRIDWLLKQKPAVVVIQLGANDGFRGLELDETEKNVRAMVERTQKAGARALLLGMKLPPNYGADYTARFEALFKAIAAEFETDYVPFFMDGVAGVPELNLEDGIHPTVEGHKKLAANLEAALTKVLTPSDE